jgi:hypothetical protein
VNTSELRWAVHGGTGICTSFDGTRRFFAGGGGAHKNSDSSFVADGGAGGGGNSAQSNANAGDGTNNTGGGGGGTGNGASTSNVSGRGGSGIVMIRYPQTLTPPAAVTGNVQVGYAAGYQIYTWTSSGTVKF